jgi:hypothetical protein
MWWGSIGRADERRRHGDDSSNEEEEEGEKDVKGDVEEEDESDLRVVGRKGGKEINRVRRRR